MLSKFKLKHLLNIRLKCISIYDSLAKRANIATQTMIVDGETVIQVVEGVVGTQTDVATAVETNVVTETSYSFICEYYFWLTS